MKSETIERPDGTAPYPERDEVIGRTEVGSAIGARDDRRLKSQGGRYLDELVLRPELESCHEV